MDNKTLVNQLAKKIGCESRDIQSLIDGLATVIKERCGDLDTIAIPGFGNIEPVKEDEKVVTDPTSGQRLLLPPAITLNFKPSAILRRRIAQ